MNKEQIIEAIKAMTVLELNELVKACEEEFGVSAAAPVAVAGAVAGREKQRQEGVEGQFLRFSWRKRPADARFRRADQPGAAEPCQAGCRGDSRVRPGSG